MIFARQLLEAYEGFIRRRPGWECHPLEITPVGEGVRFALIAITGPQCYSTLRWEAGIHRVAPTQFRSREVSGKLRVDLTTARVVVMPELENVSLTLSMY